MALLDLTFEETTFLVRQYKTNLDNIVFSKVNVGEHVALDDIFWDYWTYSTYDEMCAAWPDHITTEWPTPAGFIPPENRM